jgi:hypothetical protein
MSPSGIRRLRRAFFVIAAVAVVWSAVVALTGGFYLLVFGWRISSRDYRDALVLALVAALTAIALTWRIGGWPTLRAEWSRSATRVVAVTAAAGRRAARWLRVVSAALARLTTRVVAVAAPWLHVVPAALALGVIALDLSRESLARPLWFDEEAILLNVRDRSWSDLTGALWLGQSAPLGWLVLQRAMVVFAGSGELAVRFVPLLFGISGIVAALWIGRRWMGPVGSSGLVLLLAFGVSVSHYRFEAKHYSADVFWSLILPALAVWATEGDDARARARRSFVWWMAAACGQMLANGALLVAPGCALFLAAATVRRDGRRAAALFVLSGVLWLIAFTFHYQLSLRATQTSQYLQTYWANEFPPASMGFVDRARWIGGRLDALAIDPGGSEWPLTLWLLAALGLGLGGRPGLGAVFATVPLSAFILAALRILPLYQRFVLWIVPALYVGLALITDRAARLVWNAVRRGRWIVAALATVPLIAGGAVGLDIYRIGKGQLDARTPDNSHELDDRGAVRWLMARREPGDAILTTHLAWAAIWWYGGLSIANAGPDGVVRHPDGVALLELQDWGPGLRCRDNDLWEDLKQYNRLLVYVGFDAPGGVSLLPTLEKLGTVEAVSEHGALGRAAVINLHTGARGVTSLDRCLRVRPARRW